MRLTRLLPVAGVAALLLLTVPGAGRASASNDVLVTSPSDTAYPSYPAMSGSVSQSGNSARVTKIDLALTSLDGWTSENATLSYSSDTTNSAVFSRPVDNGSNSTVSFSWLPKPKYNGRYTFTVKSTGTYDAGLAGGGTRTEQGTATRSFNIEIAPAAPTGVAADIDDATSQVTVTWNPNPEPDLAFYQVFRSYNGGSAAAVGSAVAPSSKPIFNDDLSARAPGQYRYSVQAVRRARTCKTESSDEACSRGIRGPMSAFSAAVTVRATPQTTTTSTTIRSGGGSTGGGSTGGGTTGSGSTSGAPGTGRSTPSNTGGYAPGGNVDLSQFGSLLTGNGQTPKNPVDEGTYDPELKYNSSGKPITSGGGGDNSLITIGGTSVPTPSDDWVRFIGAGSLATALLVHVLWFKQQVDRIPLDPITD